MDIVDIEKLHSLGNDLIGVLKREKDFDSLAQAVEGVKALRSCQDDAGKVHESLEDYQERINACKQKIDKAKRETIADTEVELLQRELEEKLQEESLLRHELRVISDELDDLERQRVSLEERRELVKKKEKDVSRAEDLLSMCVSVTNIIPSLNDESRISGLILDGNKKIAEKFELDPAISAFEACNMLWEAA